MTVESEEDESAEEGEFVPSSWDHSLQPKRSSLKSPEKEAVENVSYKLINHTTDFTVFVKF